MAKKEQKKIQVLRRMTEGGIKSLGSNLWLQRRMGNIILVATVLVIWAIISNRIIASDGLSAALTFIPAFGLIFWLNVRMAKEGKKFWDKVKDKPEPIDLG